MVMANSEKTGEHPDAAMAVNARMAATLIFLVTPDINALHIVHDDNPARREPAGRNRRDQELAAPDSEQQEG